MVVARTVNCFVTVIFLVQFIPISDALQKGQDGVCEKITNMKESVCTRRDSKGKCLKFRNTIIQKTEPECCDGWEYNDDEDTCFAECLNGCLGGRCVAPNKCECDPPFILKNGNVCICGDGYEKNTDKCEPICHDCDHGVCIAPNQCKCFEGYSNTSGKCSPICKSSCFNAECSSPNKCTCLSDHQRVNDTHCKPICGTGFVNNPFTLNCEPHCDPSCENGYCITPNVCKCYEGYERNGWRCEPVCSNCKNGICIAPNKCECSPPLVLKNGKGCTCDDGYEFKRNKCEPVCNDCEHGVCIAPNKCKCFEGYSNLFEKCLPICLSSCFNGECSSPNKCTCFSGYQKVNSTHCKPSCDPGYINHPVTLNCEPHCDTTCEHGLCIKPNVCECDDGYEKTGLKCEPVCRNCRNGDCVAPNKCRCHEGYTNALGVCQPVCKEPCVNSHCSSPNVCTCKEGYIRNETETFVCNKPCKSSCNGHCANGDCICKPGYVLENDTCVYRLVDCSTCEGNCTENACTCTDGNPCFSTDVESSEVASARGLAGIELSWLLGGAIGLLLLILLAVTIQRTWRKRKQYESKTTRDENACGSVVYTIPGTLLNRNESYYDECQEEYDFEKEDLAREASEKLLTTEAVPVHDIKLNV